MAGFDGADSLLYKLETVPIGAAPPPTPAVSDVVEKVAYDTSTTIEPVQKVAEKVGEATSESLPSVELPAVEMPSIEVPSIDIPSIGGLDLPLPVLGGVAVAVLVAVVLAASGGGDSETTAASGGSSASSAASSGSSDLSIPYDAAAMLAYEEAGKPGDFESFKREYVANTVAMVKSKQKIKA